MRDYTFREVMELDIALYKLSLYEVTHGEIVIPRNEEDLLTLQDKVANTFNYFKKLIQSGECSLQFIKSNVLCKNGPFSQIENINLEDVKTVEDLIGEGDVDPRLVYSQQELSAWTEFLTGMLEQKNKEEPSVSIYSLDKKGKIEEHRNPSIEELEKLMDDNKENSQDENSKPEEDNNSDDGLENDYQI